MTPDPAAIGFSLAIVAAVGVHLLYTAVALGRRGFGGRLAGGARRPRFRSWLASVGLDRARALELVAVALVLGIAGGGLARLVYGGVLAPVVVAIAGAWVPVASARTRRRVRLEQARDAWPRMIEEMRLQIASLGRSVPQALLDVGERAPEAMSSAFTDARREWLMSTDFHRTVEVLKSGLAEPTADVVCETLLIAHETGGADVDARLRDLLEDRLTDMQGRRDARARQAGVRFARLFVLLVPFGMALVGLGIGDGRAAYASSGGQVAVVVAFGLMACCWWWAGRLLRLPDEKRVFTSVADGFGR